MKKKKKNKQKNHKKKSRMFLWFSAFLSIVILILLSVEFVEFDKIKIYKDDILVEIADDCSFIKGVGLIHEVRDNDDCSINCNNRCKMDNLQYIKVEFSQKENDCNSCKCYCR